MNLICVMHQRPWYSLKKSKVIVINTDEIKKIEPIDRNYSEEVSRVHFNDGEVIDTNEYFSKWTVKEKR